jgi:hypothetical protein
MPSPKQRREKVQFTRQVEVQEYDPLWTSEQTWMVRELLREREVATDSGTHDNIFFGKADRIHGCECMLLDTGAYKNIVGDAWVERMDKINKQFGRPKHTTKTLNTKVVLGGVGTGTQESNIEVTVPCEVSGKKTDFKATVLKNSDIPAILGMKTMQDNHGILDLRNKRLIFPKKPSDVKITIAEDTAVYQLEQAPGGYFMLPCTPGSNTLVRPQDYQVNTQ